MAKKKKDKIIWYDDNSTVGDMSNVTRTGRKKADSPPKRQSTFKEKSSTFFSAMKRMIVPMCFVLLVIGVLYLLLMVMAAIGRR